MTRHYGRPNANIHALQIEIARGLYMDEATLEKRSGYARVKRDADALIPVLAALAAELAGGA